MEDKLKLQSRANERYHDQTFEEIKELEQRSQKKLCEWCRRSTIYGDIRMKEMQSSGNSRRVRKGLDLQQPTISESCTSSMVDHDEEMALEPPRKRHEVQEVTKETAWTEARDRGEEAWRLEPEGDTEVPETGIVADEVEGTYVDSNGEGQGKSKITGVKVACQERKVKNSRTRREK